MQKIKEVLPPPTHLGTTLSIGVSEQLLDAYCGFFGYFGDDAPVEDVQEEWKDSIKLYLTEQAEQFFQQVPFCQEVQFYGEDNHFIGFVNREDGKFYEF